MEEVPEWLLFDQQQVHDTLVATSKHKPHLIADMAAMANVPGLATGQARDSVVKHTHRYASQVCCCSCCNVSVLGVGARCCTRYVFVEHPRLRLLGLSL